MNTITNISFIDLFAGLGGIRLGFEQAASELGLKSKCVLTSEIKPSAIEALHHKHPEEEIANDVRNVFLEVSHVKLLVLQAKDWDSWILEAHCSLKLND